MRADNTQLESLGKRLREARIRKGDTQSVFAVRIGVSVPTLRKMESGDPSTQIGCWIAALKILGRSEDLIAILKPEEDLFAKYEQTQGKERKRAPRRRK
jgi:transcriptional regulator with XRE-family HTH domain